jgi:hypothetical protein
LDRAKRTRIEGKKYHDIPWDDGETTEYLGYLFEMAGLGTLKGHGRIPPALSKELIWAVENVHKYPEHSIRDISSAMEDSDDEWVVLDGPSVNFKKDKG